MQGALLARGVPPAQIRVLTRAAGAPARYAAILAALNKLVTTSTAGDDVLIHFSGHGARQPARGAEQLREVDGLDEILLAADVGRWNATTGGVERALTDDALGSVVNTLTAKGVFVWLIADACYSAGSARSALGGSAAKLRTARALTLHDLGYRGAPLKSYRPKATPRPTVLSQNYVGFFRRPKMNWSLSSRYRAACRPAGSACMGCSLGMWHKRWET